MTTLDLDAAVMRDLRTRAQREGRTIGSLASELLARSLRGADGAASPFVWTTQPMRALVDLDDRGAVSRALGDE